jgi:hypothetical protein
VTIAIDFDGTITQRNEYPNIGEIRPYAAEVIKVFQKRGYFCYLWTCRHGKDLYAAEDFLKENGIQMDAYNKGPSTGSPKLIANVYIDDAAYPNNGNIDWLDIAKYFGITKSELGL